MKATLDLSLRRALMSTKDIGKFAILFIGAIVIAFGLLPAGSSAQELTLQAGTTTTVNSSQASCLQEVLPTTQPGSIMRTGCSGDQLTMVLDGSLGFTTSPHRVDVSAFSRLVLQFHVDTQPGAPDVSVLPIVITVPVSWKGILADSDIVPLPGPLASLSSFADANGQLYLATGQAGIPQFVGPTIATNNFMAATHAGVVGCLSVPKTAVQGALMIAKCAADGIKKEQGNGTIYLSGMIQTGQTYDIVLELSGHVFSFSAGGPFPFGDPPTGIGIVDFNQTLFGKIDPSAGLFWSGPMTITIGTDFQSRIAGLQNEITVLQRQLAELGKEFKNHTHVYLTGKGVGQNNTKVNTTPPNF